MDSDADDFFFEVARDTKPESRFNMWATNQLFSRGRCHLFLGLKQGYPFTVHKDVGLGSFITIFYSTISLTFTKQYG